MAAASRAGGMPVAVLGTGILAIDAAGGAPSGR
jgi:hypothetical protein